ncbi:MAG: hypothetical protein KKD30_09680 [Gammaproteobacteria bacterium]|nr:hypothetical protein [Gammaproteobacteria bacterium]MBU0883191.1 hypothetical protein [Gammaproteobacteria bacterium]MBU1860214.1 hypothetical protein [Gammaproteobacteria bacterium]
MQKIIQAERLNHIAQKVGFAIWQIQELEGAAAQFYVLVALAQAGMGEEAGNALVDQAQNKTFGSTVNKLVKGDHLPEELKERFTKFLSERNWLVHNSKANSRNAIHHQNHFEDLIKKLEVIADEALALLSTLPGLSEDFLISNDVDTSKAQAIANQKLKEWHEA